MTQVSTIFIAYITDPPTAPPYFTVLIVNQLANDTAITYPAANPISTLLVIIYIIANIEFSTLP